jgi:hypothetical protein
MSAELKKQLAQSGWTQTGSIVSALEDAELPLPDVKYLSNAFSPGQWDAAARACDALRELFAGSPCAATTEFGAVLIPDSQHLDVRAAIDPETRRGQPEISEPDFTDSRLPDGVDVSESGRAWTLAVTATSPAALALGSYLTVTDAPARDFTVDGFDTRELMIRQIWMALTLQCGKTMPDCERRESWTFTLFPGEGLVDSRAVSGTVLHGVVRQRLGKPNRGIRSARVRPALVIAGSSR